MSLNLKSHLTPAPTSPSPLDILRSCVRGDSRYTLERAFGDSLVFDEGGMFRLALTGGWIVGLESVNPMRTSFWPS